VLYRERHFSHLERSYLSVVEDWALFQRVARMARRRPIADGAGLQPWAATTEGLLRSQRLRLLASSRSARDTGILDRGSHADAEEMA
jgi:hypothetical protein